VVYSAVTLDVFKAEVGITDTTDDTRLRRVIEAATRWIDEHCERTFQPYLATRYYTWRKHPEWNLRRSLEVEDLLSVTTLKTITDNAAGIRTYGDTWAAADYDLFPWNAPTDKQPYTRIFENPEGDYSWPTDELGVQLIGKFGYYEDLVTDTTAAEAIDATETAIDVTSATTLDVLHTILFDNEQMYITAIASNTITVERGVNGTTAATHDNGSTLKYYRYPEPVVEACILEALRRHRRTDAPFGVSGSGEFGVTSVLTRRDPDLLHSLAPFRRLSA